MQFVLRHDPAGRFRFAPLQSELARRVLERHNRDARDLDTVGLLVDPGTSRERLLSKLDAVLAVLDELGGGWKLLTLLRMLPRALRDRGYDVIASRRYRWFGRYDQCPIPSPAERQRFIDQLP